MIYFEWCYNIKKKKKKTEIHKQFWQEPIPTGFAPMIFQDIYEKLGERYAIQLDRCVCSKSWQTFAAFDI